MSALVSVMTLAIGRQMREDVFQKHSKTNITLMLHFACKISQNAQKDTFLSIVQTLPIAKAVKLEHISVTLVKLAYQKVDLLLITKSHKSVMFYYVELQTKFVMDFSIACMEKTRLSILAKILFLKKQQLNVLKTVFLELILKSWQYLAMALSNVGMLVMNSIVKMINWF